MKLDMTTLFLGCCHAYGSLMTNSSLGLGSASLTRMIKMSEPLVTSILMTGNSNQGIQIAIEIYALELT